MRSRLDPDHLVGSSFAQPVHVHWSGVWGTCSVLTVSSWAGVSAAGRGRRSRLRAEATAQGDRGPGAGPPPTAAAASRRLSPGPEADAWADRPVPPTWRIW